jgi:hypothetical protein
MVMNVVSGLEGRSGYAAFPTVSMEVLSFPVSLGSMPSDGTPSSAPRLQIYPTNLINATGADPVLSRRQDLLRPKVDVGGAGAVSGGTKLTTSIQPAIFSGRASFIFPVVGTTTISAVAVAGTAAGTATAAATAMTTAYTKQPRIEYLVTTAATTAIASLRDSALNIPWDNSAIQGAGLHVYCIGGPATGTANATRRFFMGLRNSAAAPTDVNPSTLLNIIGVGYDAADTNYQIFYNGGSGTATKVDTGLVRNASDRSQMLAFEIYRVNNKVNFVVRELSSTSVFVYTIEDVTLEAKVPTGMVLAWAMYASVGGTSSVVGISFGGRYVESLHQDNFRP